MDGKKQPQTGFAHDVFLSFRGPDTRKDFTDVLSKKIKLGLGLQVFVDEKELPAGQTIDKVLAAIENSRICMPILSPDFASSKWCLREVEKMVEHDKVIVPVFFGVTPDDIKLRTPVYKDKLEKLKKQGGDEDQVERWEKALKQVASIKGFEYRGEG